MKFSKREQEAVDLFFKVALSLKEGNHLLLSSREHTLISSVLGIDLKKSTFRSKQVEQFVRDKGFILLSVSSRCSSWNYPNTNCIFPFQVSKLKSGGQNVGS